MKQRIWMMAKAIIIFGFLLVYMGCSGGGGAGDGDADDGNMDIVVLTGYFTDGPVEGLQYDTVTQSGYTGEDGSFRYVEGETVRFYIGSILIGQAIGASKITPFDLAGIAPPQTNLEIVRTMNRVNKCRFGTPFETAINITVFLQSLDEDGDFSNGIQIPERIATLATGISINFIQKYEEFPDDFQFRKLVAEGRSEGLWGGTRAIRHPLDALDTLYEGLGISSGIDARAMTEIDSDGDETTDYRLVFTHHVDGNLTMQETDPDGDGTVDSRTMYTYDTHGNRTMYENDTNADGTVDSRSMYTYDDSYNLTTYENDSDGDGIVDVHTSMTYDVNGNTTMREIDYEADGTVDYRDTGTYDSNGNLTMYEEDSDINGTVDYRVNYLHRSVNLFKSLQKD